MDDIYSIHWMGCCILLVYTMGTTVLCMEIGARTWHVESMDIKVRRSVMPVRVTPIIFGDG
jgi:hypothetical protein